MLDLILSGLPDPVVALDRDGNVLALNAGARIVAPALRPGEPASLALRVPEVVDAIRRAAATGQPERVEFFERVPLDRWFEAFITALPADQVGIRRGIVLLTFHDLTPLRRVEEMRADFVANASHELRTPLAALLGFIETLQGPARNDTAARERFLAIMQVQGTRMARLIDDLLSLSRIELNAHLRPDKLVDLIAIVRQVADGLQMLARDRGVEVKINVNVTERPLQVLGDRDELVRIFENLVENALKYAASGKRVDIDLSCRCRRGRRSGSACDSPRLRSRHRTGTSAAADRAFLSCRRQGKPRAGRDWPWPRAGQAYPQSPRRPIDHHVHVGQGAAFNIYLPLAGLRLGRSLPMRDARPPENSALGGRDRFASRVSHRMSFVLFRN